MISELSRRDLLKATGFGAMAALLARCDNLVYPSPSKVLQTASPVPTPINTPPPTNSEGETPSPEILPDNQTKINAVRELQRIAILNGDIALPLPEDLVKGKMSIFEAYSDVLKANFLVFRGKPPGTTINFPAILDGDVFEVLNEGGNTNTFGIIKDDFILYIKSPSYSISSVTEKTSVELGNPLFKITYDPKNEAQKGFVADQVGNIIDQYGNDSSDSLFAISLQEFSSEKFVDLTTDNIIVDENGHFVSIQVVNNNNLQST